MITRVLIVPAVAVLAFGGWALASPEASKPAGDAPAACAAMMDGQGVTTEGRAEMERFMGSGKMADAMTGMMQMARQMGGGDPMKGMVRMMEMMGSMGGMMAPGMMGPSAPSEVNPQDKPAR